MVISIVLRQQDYDSMDLRWTEMTQGFELWWLAMIIRCIGWNRYSWLMVTTQRRRLVIEGWAPAMDIAFR
ncbi:hypothetical protein Bca101_071649 [Brassica carinata]